MLEIMDVNPKDLKVNEYSRKLFPELRGEAYEMLKQDIKENGIRTPLEVTKDNLVLCGHERLRIALELGLEKVPVEVFPSESESDQKIRVIKDNLARKAVDTKTKLLCYRELKSLYGLKNGQTKAKLVPWNEDKIMTEDEIAKEVGFDKTSYHRAEKILDSNLPEQIKEAAFNGMIGLRPVAELVNEPEGVKEKVIPEILNSLSENRNPAIDKLTENVKQQIREDKLDTNLIHNNMERFFTRYANALKTNPSPKIQNNEVETAIIFFKRLLKTQKVHCTICGETHLKWKCGHDF